MDARLAWLSREIADLEREYEQTRILHDKIIEEIFGGGVDK